MNNKRLIFIAGQRCSGKSTICSIIEESYSGVFVIETSTLLKKLRSQDNNKNISLSKFYKITEKKKGSYFISSEIFKEINNYNNNIYIISGIRKLGDYIRLRKHFKNTSIIYIYCGCLKRYKRNVIRNRIPNINILGFTLDYLIKVKEGFIPYSSLFFRIKINNTSSKQKLLDIIHKNAIKLNL